MAEDAYERLISLPMFHGMSDGDVEDVIAAVGKVCLAYLSRHRIRRLALPKKSAFMAGSQVYLRPLERTDLTERYLGWLNDPEVTRYMETGIFPTTMQDLEKFYAGRDGLLERGDLCGRRTEIR